MVPYGGLRIDRPSTVSPPPAVAVTSAPDGPRSCAAWFCVCARGESAAQQSPGPMTSMNGRPATPDTYLMSEKPCGGVTSDVDVMPTLFALAKIVWSSGSYATPGQLVPPTAFPMLIAPIFPLTSPRM